MKKLLLTSIIAMSCTISLTAPAAVVVDSVTLSPTATGQVMQDNTEYTFASITAGGETYSGLVGGTATEDTGAPSAHWVRGTTEPTNYGAVSGLLASTASVNIGTLQIQFDNPLSSYQRFFMFDVNGDDTPTLTLIDSNGNDVGTTAYTFDSYSYGDVVYETATGMQRGTNNFTSNPFEFEGVSFTLADFTGGTGDTSSATGFRFSGDDGMDLGKLVAVIPEPSAALLFSLGCMMLLLKRRRRMA